MKKYNITVNGATYEVLVEEVGGAQAATPVVVAQPVFTAPQAVPVAPVAAPQAAPAAAPAPQAAPAPKAAPQAQGATTVTAPMPGTILQVKVTAGQAVKKGDVICVLEAMKMENDIPAPCDGVIASVTAQKGASVAAGDILASLN